VAQKKNTATAPREPGIIDAAEAPFDQRVASALAVAKSIHQQCRNWIELHNRLYGIGGLLGRVFPTEQERIAYRRTAASKEIDQLLDDLRENPRDDDDPPDPAMVDRLARANGNISLRVPRSIHAALLAEASAEGVSLNQLIAAKVCLQLRARV